MQESWQAKAESSSRGGSSCAPAAADTGPGGGSVGGWHDGPPCTSPLWPGRTSSAAATWPALPAPSFSLGTAAWLHASWMTWDGSWRTREIDYKNKLNVTLPL